MDVDNAKEMYPSKANDIGAWMSNNEQGLLGEVDQFKNDNYTDKERKRLRMVEVWYKRKEMKSLLLIPGKEPVDATKISKKDLRSIGQEDVDYRIIDKLESEMMVGIFSGPILFSHSAKDRRNYPFVPYFVQRKKSGEPYSLILTALHYA